MPTRSSKADPATGGRMRTNRSMPSSTVIPMLVYPDVAQALVWLCCTFGFAEHLRIGSHRSQLTVGDGSIVVATGLPRPEFNSNKTKAGPTSPSWCVCRMSIATSSGPRVAARRSCSPPDYPFGERQYTAEDLGGHTWTFSESIADVAPEEWGGTVVRSEEHTSELQ